MPKQQMRISQADSVSRVKHTVFKRLGLQCLLTVAPAEMVHWLYEPQLHRQHKTTQNKPPYAGCTQVPLNVPPAGAIQ